MKSSSRLIVLAAVFLATVALSSRSTAIQVTYQVNMSVQIGIGNFNPATDTVFVSGTLSNPDWLDDAADGSTAYVLMPNGSDPNIYEGTFEIDQTAGEFENHKFVINPGGTFAALNWESIANRFFEVPSENTTLPVVYWNDQDTPPGSRDVTFRVNMSVQIGLGNFDPVNDFLDVAGDFNAWAPGASTLTQSPTNADVWEGTFTVDGDAGTTAFYKFLIADFSAGANVWENNDVGPGGAQNRELTLAADNQIAPLVYFNNLTNPPTPADVTFQVDMTTQIALGNFIDGVNFVTAAGEFNAWDAVTFVLINDPSNPMVYTNTTSIATGTGSSVQWQYVIDGVAWEGNVGNRTFTFTGANQTLDTVFWNNIDDLGLVASTLSNGNANVSWNPGSLVRLQQSTGLPTWTDVEGTTGQSNAVVPITTDEIYFRLIGP